MRRLLREPVVRAEHDQGKEQERPEVQSVSRGKPRNNYRSDLRLLII